MNKNEALGAVSAMLAIVSLFGIGLSVGFLPALPVAAVLFYLSQRFRPGSWRSMATGFASGGLAGVLVLGPGFRLAMRVVAILEPSQTPEFSVAGTMMIIVFVGGLFGGLLGVAISSITGLVPSRALTPMAVGAVVGLLFLSSDLRSELTTLGAGPWVNIPMFAGVAALYSFASNRLRDRFRGSHPEPVTPQAEVRA